MKISIISGSHRNPSQSEKIGRYSASILQKDFNDIEPYQKSFQKVMLLSSYPRNGMDRFPLV
ncbi:MAG: hypothetical protein P8179_18300 [Candidatus Thiodiazotropha sp.]